jgi:tagatose 6-phosphate kinase
MILCIGTTPTVQRTMVFDALKLDDVNRAAAVTEYASGKAVNVARVLRALAHADILAVGFAGGRRGQFLLEELATENIPFDFVTTAAETRLCTTVIDRATGHATELVEESPAATPAEWDALHARVARHAESAETIVYAGTLAPGAPPDLCARHVSPTRTVVVDAKGEPLRRVLAAPAGRVIAKLNRDELAATLNQPLATEQQLLAALRAAAPANGGLIVTLGKDGALAHVDGVTLRARAPRVAAVSAVGSGDAFTAGLVAGLPQGLDHALRLATACGAANALTPHSGHVRPDDVSRLTPQVHIEKLAV